MIKIGRGQYILVQKLEDNGSHGIGRMTNQRRTALKNCTRLQLLNILSSLFLNLRCRVVSITDSKKQLGQNYPEIQTKIC